MINQSETDAPSRFRKLYELAFDLMLITIFVLAIHALFWNKFVPIQEGWFNVFSALVQQGRLPYKDFYFFLQPLYLGIVYALTSVFGNTFIILREYGLFERVLITIILYGLYRKVSNREFSLLASIVSLVLYTDFNADVIYSYYQTTLLFLLASLYFHTLSIETLNKRLLSNLLILTAGFLAGLAFTTKQTTGLLVPLASFSFIIIQTLLDKFYSKEKPIFYLLGFGIPLCGMVMWLNQYHLMNSYFQQTFSGAAASKGGLQLLFKGLERSMATIFFALPLAIILGFALYYQQHVFLEKRKFSSMLMYFSTIAVSLMGAILFFIVLKNHTSLMFVSDFFNYKEHILVSLIFDISIVFSAIFFYLYLKNHQHVAARIFIYWFLLFTTSATIIYTHSLSGVMEGPSLILGFGLFVLFLLIIKTPYDLYKNRAVVIFCLFMVSMSVVQHTKWPYEWWGWREPNVHEANNQSTLVPLRGLYMSSQTKFVYEKITSITSQYAGSNGSVYQFPHMPIFYLLSGRYPNYYSVANYFDVCSDACALETAKRIKDNPPNVFILERFPSSVWDLHEKLFRQGYLSGQRVIMYEIDHLIKTQAYKKQFTYQADASGFVVEVWVNHSKKALS